MTILTCSPVIITAGSGEALFRASLMHVIHTRSWLGGCVAVHSHRVILLFIAVQISRGFSLHTSRAFEHEGCTTRVSAGKKNIVMPSSCSPITDVRPADIRAAGRMRLALSTQNLLLPTKPLVTGKASCCVILRTCEGTVGPQVVSKFIRLTYVRVCVTRIWLRAVICEHGWDAHDVGENCWTRGCRAQSSPMPFN
jgi:hypothetical protein